jgi:hypothetical protein
MAAPTYNQPQIDPMLAPLMAQGQQQDIEAMQEHLRGDTASLLARYGAQLVSASVTPGATVPPYGQKTATPYGQKVA